MEEIKIPVFMPRRLGMDFVKDLITFVLSVDTDLAHFVTKVNLTQIP